MIKFKTGAYYMHIGIGFFKITNINEELMAQSIYNKAITVEGITTPKGTYMGGELNLSYAALSEPPPTFLGTNSKVVRVLYGSNLKKNK